MGGKNQHYIPRAVMRPFASNEQVYSYNKNFAAPLRPKGISNLGSGECFYSDDSDMTLDNDMRDYENKLSRLRDKILLCTHEELVDSSIASEYVTHLILRNAHFRETMSQIINAAMTKIFGIFSDIQLFEKIFLAEADFQALVSEAELGKIAPELENNCLPIPMPKLRQIIIFFLEELFPIWFPLQANNLADFIEDNKHITLEKARESATNAQKNSLMLSLAPQARIDSLAKFSWAVYQSSIPIYILPDCIAFTFKNEYDEPAPLVYKDINIVSVIAVPVSPQKLMVGFKEKFDIDILNNINRHAAKYSHAFFISSYRSPELEQLKGLIGENSFGIAKDKMENELNEVISGYTEGQNSRQQAAKKTIKHNTPSPYNIKIELSDNGRFKKEYMEVFNWAIKNIFGYLYARHPIMSLKKVVFTESKPYGQRFNTR